MRKLKSLVAGLAVAAALAVPAMASAAPPFPVVGEPNCSGLYVAYFNGIVNNSDLYDNGLKGVAKGSGGITVKQVHDILDTYCGKGA